jgi:hypothetical protein
MGAVRQIIDLDSSARRDEGEYPLWYLTEEQRRIAEKRPQRHEV